MMDEPTPALSPPSKPDDHRLDSWKEIASYLNRDVTTVQRWEKREGMPVHRHVHEKRGSVYAFRSELDAWAQNRRLQSEEEVVEPDSDASPGEKVDQRPRRLPPTTWIAVVGVAAAVVLTVTFGLIRYRGRHSTAPRIGSLAVLPLRNLSGDPNQEYLADGMTESLIGTLSVIQNLHVTSRTSSMHFKDTRLSIPEIAKALHVDAVVEGSVIRDGNQLRVHAQLIRTATDEHFWSETYDRKFEDVLGLESEVAQSIAEKVQATITDQDRERLANVRAVSPEAYEAYLKGRYYWNKRTGDGMQKGAVYFQEAIDKDSTYSPAYSGLADCNSGLTWHGFTAPSETLPKAYAAAQRAIQIDPTSAEAHASLGLVLSHKWNWQGAETEFKRALELNPQYANAHHWYGDALSMMGRHDEALREAKRALELDPLNLMIGTWVGLRYYLARQYDLALEQSRNTVELDPSFAAAHLLLGESYLQLKRPKEGIEELQKAASLSGGSPLYVAQIGVAYAAAGRKGEALRIVRELQQMSGKRYVSPYGLAQVYAALNDKEQTLKWLQAGFDDHAVWMTYLAVDPVFDSFRSDPRFQDLLRRVGLQNNTKTVALPDSRYTGD